MIPSVNNILTIDIETVRQPGKTYRMDTQQLTINGYTDGIEAVKQAIYKILMTERYQYLIYSWNYGVEFADLFGEPVDWVCSELERRITEALMMDDRIKELSDFEFDISKKHEVVCTFTVHTIFGDVNIEKVVAA